MCSSPANTSQALHVWPGASVEGALEIMGGLGLRGEAPSGTGARSSTPSDMLLAAGREGWVGGRAAEGPVGGPETVGGVDERTSAAEAAMASRLPESERHMGLLSSSGTVSSGDGRIAVAPWREPPATGDVSGGLADPCFFFFFRLRTVLVAVLALDDGDGDGLLYIGG